MNYYEILGVSTEANENEIKSKYRKLAMKYQPDRNHDDKKSEEMYKKVSESYEVIGDKEKMKAQKESIEKSFENFFRPKKNK